MVLQGKREKTLGYIAHFNSPDSKCKNTSNPTFLKRVGSPLRKLKRGGQSSEVGKKLIFRGLNDKEWFIYTESLK